MAYLYQILGQCVEWFSHESTDRYTDGTDFIPLTTDMRGNERTTIPTSILCSTANREDIFILGLFWGGLMGEN